MDNYIGRLLDNRYEILDVIGTGGMAVVYRARCHRLNRLVAIKILKDELSQDAEFRRRFHAESQAVAMLSHTNIVNVYDVSHSDNVDYIVMELIDGITLKQYMQQKQTLNWREALHFSTQIAKALEHAHSRGIIHRDIKPHNIMILKDGSVKVADFGIARVSSAQSTLTREALGSVHYISPEQAKGSKIDYRSDLYSLGVVLYEMLTGRTPYDGETPVSVAIQHINAQAVPPRQWNAQIPVGLEQITMRAMCADLDERYESATEMLYDLDEFRKNPSITFLPQEDDAVQTVTAAPVKTAAERAVRANRQETAHKAKTKTNKKASSSVLIAGAICILLALTAIGYFLYSFFLQDLFAVPDDVEVPNLVNEIAEQIDIKKYENFEIVIGDEIESDTVEKGRVISQQPSGGRKVKPGAVITLTVSLGPPADMMDDYINSSAQNAATLLDNLSLNLDIVIVREHNDLFPEGQVIRTDPEAGQLLHPGQTVTLFVSKGPDIQLITMKDLSNEHVDDALTWLRAHFLKVTLAEEFSVDVEKDYVIRTSPAGDMQMTEGQTVTVYVSTGPDLPMVQMEELVGKMEDDAVYWLNVNNLLPSVSYVPGHDVKGTVVFQSVKQGEEIREGSTVNLQVSMGPEEETVAPIEGEAIERIIDIPMPEGDHEIRVVIEVDGAAPPDFPAMMVDLSTLVNNELPISLTYSGIHKIQVYIGGSIWHTMVYDFNAGEVVY